MRVYTASVFILPQVAGYLLWLVRSQLMLILCFSWVGWCAVILLCMSRQKRDTGLTCVQNITANFSWQNQLELDAQELYSYWLSFHRGNNPAVLAPHLLSQIQIGLRSLFCFLNYVVQKPFSKATAGLWEKGLSVTMNTQLLHCSCHTAWHAGLAKLHCLLLARATSYARQKFSLSTIYQKGQQPRPGYSSGSPSPIDLSWLNSGHFQKTLAPNLVEEHIAEGVSPQLSLPALDWSC